MFDKIAALRKAKKMQDQIKKQLEEIYHNEESGRSSILIRGDKRIEKVILDGDERKDLKDLINDAMKQVDKKAEKKMKDQASDIMSMLGM